jgi:glycosyltransferase involved in cell wall biosynthesis
MRLTILFMQIGIDCRLPTYHMGGISQYIIHLIAALAGLAGDEHFQVFHSYKEKRYFTPGDSQRFSRSDLITPCHHPLERYLLGVELARHRLDVLHSPDFIPPASGAARRVITVHDLTFLYYPQFLTAESRRFYADQIGWAVAVADHIIADSEATRIDLINLLGVVPDRATTIHLAANPIFNADYAVDEINQTAVKYGVGRGFVLSVGTLEPRKNLPMLIRAYHQLRQRHHVAVPLVLVGSAGWMYDDIFRVIADLQLTGYVRHLTGVSDVELAHLYRAAGVLAFPSHYEGFGLPALEAMHSGCPVIASNRGSLPEVIGDAAISLDPDDVNAWVVELNRVLAESDSANSLRHAGLEQARKFTWEKTAAKTLAVYRSG